MAETSLPERVKIKDVKDTTKRSPYQPLDVERQEVRLLRVKSGIDLELLQCEFLQAFLASDHIPEYETISYRWGDVSHTRPILLHGEEVNVPASAEAAIRRMRLSNADRVLWIDALCIDQKDIDEQSRQVALMYRVYSETVNNLIWLGEDDGTMGKAVEQIAEVLQHARDETDDYKTFNTMLKTPKRSFKSYYGRSICSEPNAVLPLFARAWFSRLWIIQEASLPRRSTCYCGPFEIPLREILRTAVWINYNRSSFPLNFSNNIGLPQALRLFNCLDVEGGWFQWLEKGPTLGDLLANAAIFDVSESKDHIYGTLGLYQGMTAGRCVHSLLIPDYKKSIREIFRDAARFVIGYDRKNLWHFLQLGHKGSRNPEDDRFPSWVHDWPEKYVLSEDSHVLGGFFNAHDRISLDCDLIHSTEDPDALIVRGFRIHQTVHLGPTFTKESVNDAVAVVNKLVEIHKFLSEYVVVSDIPDECLGALLSADMNNSLRRATKEETLECIEWVQYLLTGNHPVQLGRTFKNKYDAKSWQIITFHACFQRACFQRRVFAAGPVNTNLEFAGLGPRHMEANDIIAILFGCNWPVVLQPKDKHYLVVGVCYLQGVMYGEAARKHRGGAYEEENFVLR